MQYIAENYLYVATNIGTKTLYMETIIKMRNKASLSKSALIIISSGIIYSPDLKILFNDAISDDIYSYFLLMPFLIIYLIYRKKDMILASMSYSNSNTLKNEKYIEMLFGFIIIVFSIILRLYGSYSFLPVEMHILSLPLFIIGSILLLFNLNTVRVLIFPIIYLLFLIPIPISVAQQLGTYLSYYGSKYSYYILNILGFPVELSYYSGTPVIIIDSSFGLLSFSIDLACSGLYSLTGFIVFAVFLAYISRIGYKKKSLILLLGVPIIYILNIIRISLIVIVGYFYGESVALNSIHLLGGSILTFSGTFLIFIILEKFFHISFFNSITDDCIEHSLSDQFCHKCGRIITLQNSTSTLNDYLGVGLIILITISSFFIQVPVFSLSDSPGYLNIRDISTGSTTEILPSIEGYNLTFSYRDRYFEEISKQNASLMYRYVPIDPSETTVWVGLEIGKSRVYLHPWEVCLVTYPSENQGASRVKQLDLYDIHMNENPPISARYFAYQDKTSNVTQTVLYWYTSATFHSGQDLEKQFVKISVIEVLGIDEMNYELTDEVYEISKQVIDYWEPKSEWSNLALFLVQIFDLILYSTIILLSMTSTYYVNLYYQKIRDSNTRYDHITERDKLLIDYIEKNTDVCYAVNDMIEMMKENDVILEYPDLLKLLSDAESVGLVNRVLVSINDKPYLTWKTNIRKTLSIKNLFTP